MKYLELLAPARTAEIGIAAIDCGADAVYIAGPGFGARQAAGNSVEDIARLCGYAHRFGARIFVTVNTIIYDQELAQVQQLVQQLESAGVDALIVQDPAVLGMSSSLVMHASTQCAIRTPEKARFIESLGYGRLVLERQLSLQQIKAISEAVDAEIEFFVHGALCVCYSGQCYLSEYLTGRSANRGACAQACRSLYNLEDTSGKVLVHNKALLSLKDYNLLHRLKDLAEAGVCSFKIEGRLKGESYVRNVVKAYSDALNTLVAQYPDRYRRSSFGGVRGGFTPDLDKTFNRGYTSLFLDGARGPWAAEGGGEFIGSVQRLTRDGFVLEPASKGIQLSNGDGLTFEGGGFRADVCEGYTIHCKKAEGLKPGTKLFRNSSVTFERQVEAAKPIREITVQLNAVYRSGRLYFSAVSEDGRKVCLEQETPTDVAREQERMLKSLKDQLAKRSGHYAFTVTSIQTESPLPFMSASFLNSCRRSLAGHLDQIPVKSTPLRKGNINPDIPASSPLTITVTTDKHIAVTTSATAGEAFDRGALYEIDMDIDALYGVSKVEITLNGGWYTQTDGLGLYTLSVADYSEAHVLSEYADQYCYSTSSGNYSFTVNRTSSAMALTA